MLTGLQDGHTVQRPCIMFNTEKRVCINVTWSPGLMYGAKTVHYVEYRKEGMYKCYLVTWTDVWCKDCPLC